MKRRIIYISFLLSVCLMFASVSFADRGVTDKNPKNKVGVNISKINRAKESYKYSLLSGFTYVGSNVTHNVQIPFYNNIAVTYKYQTNYYTNTYKKKVLTTEIKQGYTGSKLIINLK